MSFQTTVYGKYFLLDRIAVGGMAEVFKAKTYGVRGFERLLVIKRILPHLSKDDEFVEMFIDEAKISVELNHANICQVTDLGKIQDNYFIAMEYIDGKDLRAILKKCYTLKTPLAISAALYIAMEALKGLDYAHRKSHSTQGTPLHLIHRDISPQNVMVSYHGDVKIVDFGIAKTESKLNKTQAGVLKGKFGYMSPEQASGLELDARTDVFSAGILLYEMLTGRRLFLGENDFETLEKIKDCDVPPPSKYNPQIPPELEEVVFKSLAKEREDRFASAQDFQTAVARIFYSQFSGFSSRDLSDFLQSIFSEEMEQEKEALRRAIDSLPAEEVEGAISSAESGERVIDSGASRRSPNLSGSQNRRMGPIGSSRVSQTRHPSGRKSTGLLKVALFLLLPAMAVTGVLWFWNKPKKPATSPTKAELVAVQISTEPVGATVIVQGQLKGATPLTVNLPENEFVDVQMEKEGFVTRIEKISATKDRTAFGPYVLEKALPSTGSLSVTSTPDGAQISVNGQNTRWFTPAVVPNLPMDQPVRIRVALKGYNPKTETVTLKERKETHFDLDRALATLVLNVDPPNADVFLDGKEHGHEILDLVVGKTYKLKVMAPGYRTYEKAITILNSKEIREIPLKKIPVEFGTITIGANPWAKVIIDGKDAGETPIVNHTLPVGKHVLEFSNPHFRTVKKVLRIEQGKNTPVSVDLRESNE